MSSSSPPPEPTPPPHIPSPIPVLPPPNSSISEIISTFFLQIQEYSVHVAELIKDSIPNSNPDSVITNWVVTVVCVVVTFVVVVLFVAVGELTL